MRQCLFIARQTHFNRISWQFGMWLLIVGLVAMLPSPAMAETEVYVGKVTTVKVGTVERVAVGNESVVEVTALDNGRLLLLGVAPGLSDVYVWTTGERLRKFTVRVFAEPQEDQISRIRAVTDAFPGVEIKQQLGVVVLSGKVDAAEFERFQSLVGNFGNVISMVEPELNIEILDSIVLDVKILEVNRSAQRQLGLSWQDTPAGPAVGVAGIIKPNNNFGVAPAVPEEDDLQALLAAVGTNNSTLSSFIGLTSIFGSQLDLLQEEGAARTLAQPSLSTVSGEPAEFLAGGQIPIAVLNQFGQPVVELREFGIKLEIEPIMDRNKNIRSRILASISSVDFSTAVNGQPGFLERSSTSTITARPGETIVISGLVNTEDARNADKVPGLADIPILGKLFRSDGFRKQRTELIITVTPRIQEVNQPLKGNLLEADRKMPDVLNNSDKLDKALMW